MSAPAGSGKSVLLRSWIGEAGLGERAAWVPVGRGEGDPQRFWLSVLGALRQTAPGSGLVRGLTAAPDLDGWAIVERLLKDVAPLEDRLWLVVDDVHELGSAEALRQLELLLMRAPDELRFVLATRHDLRLGLHRLRLEGELTEIRAAAAPDQVTALHQVAAEWFGGHGFAVEAIRHAQTGQDWGLAVRLLGDHWPGLQLGGQAGTVHALLAGFPAGAAADDAELAALVAADELAQGSLEEAERYLGVAARGSAWVPAGRRGQLQVLPGMVRLLLARQRGDLLAVAGEAQRLQAMAESPDAAQSGIGEELRALALINLGSTEYWAARLDDEEARLEKAQRHLEQGVALARRIGRPFLEFSGLAFQAVVQFDMKQSFARAAECSRQAVELAERHGWTDEPAVGIAYAVLAAVLAWQGGRRRHSPGSSAPSAPSEPKPSPRPRWWSTPPAG